MKVRIEIILLFALLCSACGRTKDNKKSVCPGIYCTEVITRYNNHYRPDSLLDKVVEHGEFIEGGRHSSKEVTEYIYTHTIKEGKLTCTKKQEVVSNGKHTNPEYTINLTDGQEIFTLNGKDTLSYELKKYNKQGQIVYEKSFTRGIKVPEFEMNTRSRYSEKEFCYDDNSRLYFQRTHIKDENSEAWSFNETTVYRDNSDEIVSITRTTSDLLTYVTQFKANYSADTLIQHGYCDERLAITIKTLPNYKEEVTYGEDGSQSSNYNIIKDNKRIEIHKSELYISNKTKAIYTDSLFYDGGLLILDKHSSPEIDRQISIEYDNKGNKTLVREKTIVYNTDTFFKLN